MGENLKIASLHHSLCLSSDQIIAEVLLQQNLSPLETQIFPPTKLKTCRSAN